MTIEGVGTLPLFFLAAMRSEFSTRLAAGATTAAWRRRSASGTVDPTLVVAAPSFIHGTVESRTYAVRPRAPGGVVTLSRDPSHTNPETTEIGVPHHGQGGEVDSPKLVVWFQATFGDCAGLRETWDGCWSIDDPALATILETRLAAMADLIERRLKTTDPALAPAIMGARPAAFRRETLRPRPQ